MEGSAEDPGAPDSWELADLDESMTRLMLSSGKKNPATSPSFPAPEFGEELLSVPCSLSLSSSVPGNGGLSEDALSGVDQFLREALENPRERLSILRMEQDIEKFIRDPRQQQLEFQQLPTSYLRLAAHRVAQHYSLQSMVIVDSNLPDGSGSRIVVRKTSDCGLPLIRLADIPVNLPQEDTSNAVKVAIKQRPQKRPQNINNSNTHSSRANHSKSVEERKEEYNRARARIFNANSSGGIGGRPEGEPTLPVGFQQPTIPVGFQQPTLPVGFQQPTIPVGFQQPTLPVGFQQCSLVPAKVEEKSVSEGLDTNLGRGFRDSSPGSSSSSRSSRSKTEKEKEPVNRYRVTNRVAIFRDREVDRKDPDYDRNYDRYMQRFDPGFGFTGGPYTMQPMYSPAINYNTEFPQLGRPQVPIEHPPRSIPHHLRGPWAGASPPSGMGYGPPDSMMPPTFNPNHVGTHSASAIYLHSPQYACPRPAMAFVHPHEHVHQPFAQHHQQQPEASFGLARPR